MPKRSARKLRAAHQPLTPRCHLCESEHIPYMEDATVTFKGQWFELEGQAPIFVLDPDTKLRVLQMENGIIGLIPDINGHPTKHAHQECFHDMVGEYFEDEL